MHIFVILLKHTWTVYIYLTEFNKNYLHMLVIRLFRLMSIEAFLSNCAA